MTGSGRSRLAALAAAGLLLLAGARPAATGWPPSEPEWRPVAAPTSTGEPGETDQEPVLVVTDPHCGTCV